MDGIIGSTDMSLSKLWEMVKDREAWHPQSSKELDMTERLNNGEYGASLVAQMVKNTPQCSRPGFVFWVRKIPWRREWQPTPVFLPGRFHGQRSLAGYSPWDRKESNTTE